MIQALAEEAAAAGITSTEAMRQIIWAYNARPFPFHDEEATTVKSGVLAKLRVDQVTIDSFAWHASAYGVSVAEGIRQCVRRYLTNKGRTV